MLKNYLKIALRSLYRYKVHSFINTLGLAIGMGCCLLIFLFVRNEWSYDDFHAKRDSIYSLYIQEEKPDGNLHYRRLIPLGIPEALATTMPAVKSVVQMAAGEVTIIHENQAFREEVFEADSSFFAIFSFPLLAGNPGAVLNGPASMVISEDIAQKYFGGRGDGTYGHVLGKILSIRTSNGWRDFTITGVMKNFPSNSSLKIAILISFKNYAAMQLGSNDWNGRTSAYVLLDKGEKAAAVEQALRPFTAIHFKNRIERQKAEGTLADRDDALQLRLQPLRHLHLDPKIPVGYEEPIHNPRYSYILSGMAALVLLIASINFTTLAVARAASRAREVALRKTVGAQKRQLVMQFWGESLLLSFFALLLGLAITDLTLPLFNNLTGTTLSLAGLGKGIALLVLPALVITVGFLAGGYPAIALSAFQPATVLKGEVKTGGASLLIRSLVGIQYIVSIALITCALVMGEQVTFLQGKDLGYNDDLVVVIPARQTGAALTVEKYRHALAGNDQVIHVISAGQAFTRSEDTRLLEGTDGRSRMVYVYGADYDYVDLLEMQIVAGRNFSRAFTTDPTAGVLVNEALVREFGFEDPIGKRLQGFIPETFKEAPAILGVVKDFNFKSLHQTIKPVVLTMHPNYWARYRNIYVKIRPDDIPAAIALLKEKWGEVAPDMPFDYFFLDQDVQTQYQAETRWVALVRSSMVLALVIACMGLFALAALAVSKRTKEIGIRKVLGASIAGIIGLLSKDFITLVLGANLFAWPMAYFAMNKWLQDFAYRINIGWRVFALAGGLVLIIALLSVSSQAIKAALTNPVEALRYE